MLLGVGVLGASTVFCRCGSFGAKEGMQRCRGVSVTDDGEVWEKRLVEESRDAREGSTAGS
jgi:hypothetical protein